MPELPEVEVVRRGLAEHALGATIDGVKVLHPRAVRRQLEGPAHVEATLVGRRFTDTGRRGKFLWLATDEPDLVLAAHLGMSGQFRVESAGCAVHRHARVRIDLGERTLWFVDQRTFGWVGVFPMVADPGGVLVPEPVRDIAVDPTDPVFDVRAVARALRTHRVEVKRLLLDQSHVSGIGNIYADEALWAAGVHPRRRADRLSVAALVEVLEAATEVMSASLAQGGTSFDSLYVNVNGASGYFGRGLSVYGRAGLPCPRCGAVIVRERFMNRSSHFCPRCQSAPRSADWGRGADT